MASLKHTKSGQSVNVPAEAVDYYLSKGWTVSGAAVPEASFPDGEPSKDWKNDQIVAYAEREGIDLADATKKDDMLAVIAGVTDSSESDSE